MTRILDPRHNPHDHALVRRLVGLTALDPQDVTLDQVIVHRNHIDFTVFARDRSGFMWIDARTWEPIRKHRIVRNPNPRLARAS